MKAKILLLIFVCNVTYIFSVYVWPISGTETPNSNEINLNSFYGPRSTCRNRNHQGIDIGCYRAPVKTVTNSIFQEAGSDGITNGRGKYLIYKNSINNTILYHYFHLSRNPLGNLTNLQSLNPGINIGTSLSLNPGINIGTSGNTGEGHAYHLHFAVSKTDQGFIHPLKYLPYPAESNIIVKPVNTESNKITLQFTVTPNVDLDQINYLINLNNGSQINRNISLSPYDIRFLNPINSVPATGHDYFGNLVNLIQVHPISGTAWTYALKGERLTSPLRYVLTLYLKTESTNENLHAESVSGQAINVLGTTEKTFSIPCGSITGNVLLLGDATGSMYHTEQDKRKISFFNAFHTSLNSNRMYQSLYKFYCNGSDWQHPQFINLISEGIYSYDITNILNAYIPIAGSASTSNDRLTLFHEAILSAKNALFMATPELNKHIVLVSDGKIEPPYEDETDIMNAALSLPSNQKLHTIGLLDGTNQRLMKKIATWGKGHYYYLGPWDNPYEISTALQSEILSTPINTVQNGILPYTGNVNIFQQAVNKTIYVDNQGYPIKCNFTYFRKYEGSENYVNPYIPLLTYNSINKRIKIYTPNNTLIQETDTALLNQYGITIINSNNSDSIRDLLVSINNPTQGNWKVIIEVANTNNNSSNVSQNVRYTFSSLIDSKVFIEIDRQSIENAKPKEAIIVKANVLNLNNIPLDNVTFNVEVGIPRNPSVWLSDKITIPMVQDPIDPTIYKCYLTNTNNWGSYSFKVNFTANLNGSTIERTAYCYTYLGFSETPDTKTYHNGWNWVSYPRLYIGNENDYAQGYESLFSPISTNLNQVLGLNGQINKTGNILTTEDLELIYQNEGYKLNFLNLPNNTLTACNYGTIIDPYILNYLNQDQNVYWLGYYRSTSQDPLLSFSSSVRPYIESIKGEDWFMYKVNGNWAQTNYATFEYGKSYEVTFSRNRNFDSFQLILAPLKEIVQSPTPQFFSFKDLPDYQCVLVDSISNVDDIQEVAVYQDTTCVGATVFDGYPIHIKAYVNTESKSSDPLTFRLITAAKKALTIKNALIYDNKTNSYYPSIIEANPKKLAKVLLNANDCDVDPVIVPLSLKQNYPNPFNPNTKIKFSIPTEGNVKICIYNVKGQKVIQLMNKTLNKGFYSVDWNGKDENNNSVASGVYFYQLETNKNVLRKKMLLIK